MPKELNTTINPCTVTQNEKILSTWKMVRESSLRTKPDGGPKVMFIRYDTVEVTTVAIELKRLPPGGLNQEKYPTWIFRTTVCSTGDGKDDKIRALTTLAEALAFALEKGV